MIGWTFLYAFITFITFISLLIAVASLAVGSIKRDRSLVVFGLKALVITILGTVLFYALAFTFMKDVALHFKSILKSVL